MAWQVHRDDGSGGVAISAVTLHSNRGMQGAFVLKSRTGWMGADAT
jgi:hypothetical protein